MLESNQQQADNKKKNDLPKWAISTLAVVITVVVIWLVYYFCFSVEENDDKLFTISIGAVYDTQQIGDSLLGETTNELFVVVPFSIRNKSNEEITLYKNNCKLKIGDATYEPTTVFTGVDNELIISEDIGSGITKQLTVVFEIPLISKYASKSFEIKINRATQSYNISYQSEETIPDQSEETIPEKKRIEKNFSEVFTINGLEMKVIDCSTMPGTASNFVEVNIKIHYNNPTAENIKLRDMYGTLYFVNDGTEASYNSRWYSNPDNVTFKPYEEGDLTYHFEVPNTIVKNLGKGKDDPSATSYFEVRYQLNKTDATEYYAIKI